MVLKFWSILDPAKLAPGDSVTNLDSRSGHGLQMSYY